MNEYLTGNEILNKADNSDKILVSTLNRESSKEVVEELCFSELYDDGGDFFLLYLEDMPGIKIPKNNEVFVFEDEDFTIKFPKS